MVDLVHLEVDDLAVLGELPLRFLPLRFLKVLVLEHLEVVLVVRVTVVVLLSLSN